MIVSKTRNANGSGKKGEKLKPNGVKCNEKHNWVSVLRLAKSKCIKCFINDNV